LSLQDAVAVAPQQEHSCSGAPGGSPDASGANSLVVGSFRRDHEGMPKRLRVLAYALFGFTLVLAAVAVVGALLLGVDAETAWSSFLITNTVIGLSAAPCGLLIARAKPDNPIGWLFLITGVAPLLTAAVTPFVLYGAAHDWSQLTLRLLVTMSMFAWSWGVFCCLPLIVQLFPTGKPLSRRWVVLCWLTVANALLGNMFVGPTPEYGASSLLIAPWWAVTEGIAGVVSPLIILASVASLVVRFVRGIETVRQQIWWLVIAVILVILINLPIWFAIPTGQNILLLLSFPLIPAAVTIAVLRHGLYDVRIVVSRVIVYALLTGAVIAVYVGLVAVLDRVLRGVGAPVIAALAIALAFNPVRVRLQRLVDRAVYGARHDPVAAVSAVGQRLAGEDLIGVADALRDALRLSYVAITREDGSLVESGEPTPVPQTWALTYDGKEIGNLVVGPRRGEQRLSRTDQKVIDLVAAPLALVLRAQALTEDLKASRERVIDAAEEERTRLRRELHDSLGPILTGAAFKADGIALAAQHKPERAESLAIELADQLRQSVEAVRRLAYGLRPAALDELGLVGALREEGSRFGPVKVIIEAPEAMPVLPSSVEVAAYRIAAEALTNVVRHSDARYASIRLTTNDGTLEMIITDNGSSTAPWSTGLGLTSIKTRAFEVGGDCEAGPTAEGGRVVAVLPLRVSR
jgi:two-component system, NarL family, sensor kinase